MYFCVPKRCMFGLVTIKNSPYNQLSQAEFIRISETKYTNLI